MSKKGVIVEISPKYLIILNEEGEFVRAKKELQYCDIGEEIFYIESQKDFFKLPSFSLRLPQYRVATILAMVAFLVFFQFHYFATNQAYAYVAIDSSPSLELVVNKDMKVIDIETFNKEAVEVVNLLNDWKNENVKKVTKQIVEIFTTSGYIKQGSVVITTTYIKNKKEIEEEVQEAIEEVKEENEVQVVSQEATVDQHEKSEELNISVSSIVNKNKDTLMEGQEKSKTPPLEKGNTHNPSSSDKPVDNVGIEKEKKEIILPPKTKQQNHITKPSDNSRSQKKEPIEKPVPHNHSSKTFKENSTPKEVKEELKETKVEAKKEIKEIKQEVKQEVKEVKEELKEELKDTKKEINEEIKDKSEDVKNITGNTNIDSLIEETSKANSNVILLLELEKKPE